MKVGGGERKKAIEGDMMVRSGRWWAVITRRRCARRVYAEGKWEKEKGDQW